MLQLAHYFNSSAYIQIDTGWLIIIIRHWAHLVEALEKVVCVKRERRKRVCRLKT